MYSECAKLKDKPLQHKADLDIRFPDVAATAEFAYAPNSGVMPRREPEDEWSQQTNSSTPGIDEQCDDVEMTHSSQLNFKRVYEGITCNPRPKKIFGAKQSNQALSRIVDAAEASSSTSRTVGPSISDCLQILKNIPGVSTKDPIYPWAARAFVHPQVRDAFISLEEDDVRMNFLKLEIAIDKKHLGDLDLD